MEEEVVKRPYKIMLGDTIYVHRKDVREYTFYTTNIKQKLQDGTEMILEKRLNFPKGAEIQNGEKIKILDMFENGYKPKNSYDVIWSLFIKEYEVIPEENVFDEYNQSKEDFNIDELESGNPDYEDNLPF